MKRVLALIGAALLIIMYLMTLIAALSGSENYWNMLMASVACTIIVPVLLYAYGLIYKLLKDRAGEAASHGGGSEAGGEVGRGDGEEAAEEVGSGGGSGVAEEIGRDDSEEAGYDDSGAEK